MMSFRRFVNLVSSDALKRVYALRRIDMSRFFLPTTNGTKLQDCLLPDPVINFYSPQYLNGCGDMDFFHVDDKVVATDGTGGAFIYDTGDRSHAVRSLPPPPTQFKKCTTSLAVGSNLYVIDRFANGSGPRSFQALLYTGPAVSAQGKWHWRVLPPPPPPPPCVRDLDDLTSIDACAAVADGSRIWMSAVGQLGMGAIKGCTHLFDTQRFLWTSQPADWELPFTGTALYVPDLQNLWFGISSRDHGHAFCAADLATASLSQPPVLRKVFDDDMAAGVPVPEDCLVSAHAVHLGSGRFCIVRFFYVRKRTPDDDSDLDDDEEIFIVVAGVEVVSGGDGDLTLVKHRSERYMLLDHQLLHWVL